MSIEPEITFKAGKCQQNGTKVVPTAGDGYIYLYRDSEDLTHFCWRRRSQPVNSPDLDLIVLEDDGKFYALGEKDSEKNITSPTNGRIYVLRFESSGQRHFFWLQSKSQHPEGQLNWFSARDKRIGDAVNAILNDSSADIDAIMDGTGEDRSDDEDGADDGADDMEVDDAASKRRGSQTGGAGADATGGDPRREGEASREGGADGGRAVSVNAETNAIVRDLIKSLQQRNANAPQSQVDKPFTTLPDLLAASTTIPFIDSASPKVIDNLCTYLPSELFLLAQESFESTSSTDPSPSAAVIQGAIEALSQTQKKTIIKRVMHSPQLQQSLGSLMVALRDGGLPMIGEALGLSLENGGMIRGGTMPLGGGAAVQAFVEGVKDTVQKGKQDETLE